MAPLQRRRRHWASRLFAGLAALVTVVTIVAGAPLLLLEVAGNPLPQHMPSIDEITTLLTSQDNGSVFLRLLTLVGWGAWLTFTLSVLVEIPAQLRGRRARRIPGLGLQQRVAAALVGATFAVFIGSGIATAALAPAAPAAAVATVQGGTAGQLPPTGISAITYDQAISGGPVQGELPKAMSLRQQLQRPVYVVRKYDQLGAIAQRFTGDLDRYQQIAALNPKMLTDPDHIEPGWRLTLPADAYDRGVIRHATGHLVVPATENVKPPVTQEPATPPPPPPPPVEAQPSVQPSVQPSAAAPSAQPSAAPSAQAEEAGTPGTGATYDPIGEPVPEAPADSGPGLNTLAAGAGLAAAVALATHVVLRRRIRRLHQLRLRRRRTTEAFRPLSEAESMQMARHRAADRLDAGLRRLAIGLRDRSPEEMPDIVAAWQYGGDLAVILGEPCAGPPVPYETQGPNTWSLPATARLPENGEGPSLLPGLLKVGTWPQGSELFVDGERTGLLTLTGDPQRCDNLLRHLASDAAGVPWVDGVTVLVAGLSMADMRALAAINDQRIRVCPSVDDALARISRRAMANDADLRDTGMADAMSARIHNVTEAAWSTHLLFVADPWGEHTEALHALDAQLAELGRVGVAVIATQPTPSRWSAIVGADGTLDLSWLAVRETDACQLSSDQLAAHAEAVIDARGAALQPAAPGPRHRLVS